MDFTTTEAANDLGGLVDTIVDSVCTPEHQRELDGLDQRFDRKLWGKLIDADVLSSASAPSLGGDGFGVLEQVAILVALGHQLAAVPYLDIGDAGRRSAGPVRVRGAAAELGCAGGAWREDPHRGIGRRDGRRAGAGHPRR